MCYSIYLSTNNAQDLSELNSEYCRFDKFVGEDDQEIVDMLVNPFVWYLSVYAPPGCSCHFRCRIDRTSEPFFEEPQEWSPEDPEEIGSTLKVFDHFKTLVDAGFALDIVNVWTETTGEEVLHKEIRLSEIPRAAFRFIEDMRFVISK